MILAAYFYMIHVDKGEITGCDIHPTAYVTFKDDAYEIRVPGVRYDPLSEPGHLAYMRVYPTHVVFNDRDTTSEEHVLFAAWDLILENNKGISS